METFSDFYNSLSVEWPFLFFMMFMSMGVAIFHTLIIGELFNINFRPKWLFFIVNPALIAIAGLVDVKLGVLVFIILFLSVFVLGILGMIISSISDGYKRVKREDKERVKMGKKPLPWWIKILGSLSTLFFFGFMLSLGPAYFIIIIFIILPFLTSIFKKSNKKIFYKLQRVLPTSNIRSVAMGLAEISGKAKTIDTNVSRISSKNCIGFYYTIESISTDSDGDKSYSLEFSETVCNPFFLEDNSGKIKVMPSEIEFIDFGIDEQYHSALKRYTQYLLVENQEVLLIGKAGLGKNNEPVFEKEEIKNVFGMAPVASVANYNEWSPIMQSAGYFIYFWVITIALLLITPINLKNNTIEFGEINWKIPFQDSRPINSIDDFYDMLDDSYNRKEIAPQEVQDTQKATEETK
ncbi:hypothetical protein [Flavobacterium hydrophilum]|uniref:Uncharacterized protein n=1 Tax=Flavobacterium hydrophilum TaxID=2211445 RepID=A0A2V4BZX6_9FLAO|nr:hypothetical protein [Flavobacterium hydrophilum]PXY44588.1 hypothetical protein DMB68_14080 [Flavobacterium hydrophilum]